MDSPLKNIKAAYHKKLVISPDDELLIDYIYSLVVANIHKKLVEPVWGYIIGPPSTGKTEPLRPLQKYPDCISVSSLTENALISGYRDDQGNDPSLIKLLDGKVMVWKDLTALLLDTPHKVTKILGDLRDAFDGTCSKPSGRVGLAEYKAKFGIIAAVTDYIDTFSETNQQLGERFIAFRTCRSPKTTIEDITYLNRIFSTFKNKEQWRSALRVAVWDEMTRVKKFVKDNPDPPTITQEERETLSILAYLLSQLRTTPIKGVPVTPESGARVVQQLLNLGSAHALLDERATWNEEDMILVKRVVIDTMTIVRRRILMILYGSPGRAVYSLTSEQLAKKSRTPLANVTNVLNQYEHIGMVERNEVRKSYMYSLAPQIRKCLAKVKLLEPGPHLPAKIKVKAK